MSTEIGRAKQRLRYDMRERCAAMGAKARAEASWRICARLVELFDGLKVTPADGPIAAFLPTAREPAIEPFVERLMANGFELMAPGAAEAGETAHFLALERTHILDITSQGFRVPAGAPRREITDAAVVLVPGLAFDFAGRRLGKGGGWYDRALTGNGYRIGIAFGCQMLEEVPCEEHDKRVDAIVTENGTTVIRERGQHE